MDDINIATCEIFISKDLKELNLKPKQSPWAFYRNEHTSTQENVMSYSSQECPSVSFFSVRCSQKDTKYRLVCCLP